MNTMIQRWVARNKVARLARRERNAESGPVAPRTISERWEGWSPRCSCYRNQEWSLREPHRRQLSRRLDRPWSRPGLWLQRRFAACQQDRRHPAVSHTDPRAGRRRRQVRTTSCSPAACHPHATSSGHQRYPTDNHGHFEEAGGLGAPQLTWGGGGGRNCMACKGSLV